MAADIQPPQTQTISRTELCWLAGAVIFGAIVRLSFPGRMAIEHFDEGVYASNFWLGEFPYRHLYAPPLLPACIEWTMIIAALCGIKPTGFIPMIPCLIAGIATIPSIWWIGRRWFGPSAGLISAWLVATSDFHASYSRAALTDVPLCLFILWAVYFMGRALAASTSPEIPNDQRKRSKRQPNVSHYPWKDVLFAGGFTSLAWWTKYNGWLPLAIGLAGGTLWQLLTPGAERQIRRVLCTWILVSIAAGVFWSPVLWDLQKHGGYASVAANHRQYIVGFAGWSTSAFRQLKNIGVYENPLDVLYLPFFGPQGSGDLQSGDLTETLISLFVPVASLLISSLICIRTLIKNRQKFQLLTVCLVAAWFAGLTVATPFYYPYPRLVLPWIFSTWICLGLVFRAWKFDSIASGSDRWSRIALPSVIATLLFIFILRLGFGSAHCWENRIALQSTANQFADAVKKETTKAGLPESDGIVYVLGEPAIVFGLKAAGLGNGGPVADLSFARQRPHKPTFIAFSFASITSDVDREQLEQRFESVDRSNVPRSHLVLYDGSEKWPRQEGIRLYRQVR